MKSKFLGSIGLLTAIFMASCSNEGLNIDNNREPGNTEDVGALVVSNLNVECVTDKREPEVGVESKPFSTSSEDIDINRFECKIINEQNEVLLTFLYGERPTAPIELPTGGYTFHIASAEVPQEQALWEQPIYGKIVPFKIVRNDETELNNIVCTLMQIQVSVSYSPDLLARLNTKSVTTIEVGTQSLDFVLTERRSGFFYAPLDNNTITLTLNGTYSPDGNIDNGKPISMTKTIENVKAGQHSDIHLYIEHADEGTITISTEIKDWITDDVIGTTDISTSIAEAIIDENGTGGGEEGGGEEGGQDTPVDPNDPVVVWEGYGFEERYPIVVGQTSVELNITAPRGIKSFLCTIDSEVLTPDELLKNNLCNVLNLCDATKSYDSRNPEEFIDIKESLDQLSIDNGDKVLGQTYVHLSITQFIPVLKMTGAGNHNFILVITDNNDVTITRTLRLVS